MKIVRLLVSLLILFLWWFIWVMGKMVNFRVFDWLIFFCGDVKIDCEFVIMRWIFLKMFQNGSG